MSVVLLLALGLFALSIGWVGDPHGHTEDEDCAAVAAPGDGCSAPCEGEGEDGTCPAGCDDCVCCPAPASSTAVVPVSPAAAPPTLRSVYAPPAAGSPVDRPAPRLFRPPRTSLS
jgi:hypothetical protein